MMTNDKCLLIILGGNTKGIRGPCCSVSVVDRIAPGEHCATTSYFYSTVRIL